MHVSKKYLLESLYNGFKYFAHKTFINEVFSYIDLSDINFSGSKFFNCRFSHCTLDDAVFKNTQMMDTHFHDCFMKSSNFEFSRIKNSTFDQCDLQNSNFNNSNIVNSLSKKCRLNYSLLESSNIDDSKFIDVSFYGASMMRAKLKNVEMDALDIRNCVGDGAKITTLIDNNIIVSITNDVVSINEIQLSFKEWWNSSKEMIDSLLFNGFYDKYVTVVNLLVKLKRG